MDSRVCLEIKALLENLENQETWVFLESSVLWDKLDQGESVAFLEREENLVPLACRDLRASLVHLDQMGLRVVPVLPVPSVTRGLQVSRECQEREAFLAPLGPKATEAPLVRKDQKVHLETTAPEGSQVQSAH